MIKKICVLTGAGVSAESGIQTFRGSDGLWEGHDGLWEGHDVMEVASPEGFRANPALVLDFYNQRRAQLNEVVPNQAHLDIADLENDYEVTVITQNVDDLHERAGSSQIIHLHGELRKIRSVGDPSYVIEHYGDILMNDLCPHGYQLRPHIVWFGEAVPMLESAIQSIIACDAIIIIGTSMQVYPAASLTSYAPQHAPIYYVDPNPNINYELSQSNRLKIFKGPATIETKKAIQSIRSYRS